MKGPSNTARGGRRPTAAELSALYEGLLQLKTKDDCARFLRDLCTISEIDAIAERFSIARMLSKNDSYRVVADKTGSSTTTVTRVAHWFHHGTGGYRTVISRMKR